MAEIQEIEMARGREDEVKIAGPKIKPKQAMFRATRGIKDLVQRNLATVPGKPFQFRPLKIPRLPFRFHQADATYYQPALVAIGPYHHSNEFFGDMEYHKWSTLRDFLARSDEVRMEDYYEEIRALEQSARMCYSGILTITSDELVNTLVLDGCFILEFILKLEYEQIDALLFMTGWASSILPTDMLLLENQVPFFIIHKLFDICVGGGQDCEGKSRKGHCPLLKLIFKHLVDNDNTEMKPPQEPCDSFFHLLHFYHACMVTEADHEMEHNSLVTNQSLSSGNKTFSRFNSLFRRKLRRAKEERNVEEKRVREVENAKEKEPKRAKEEENDEEKGAGEEQSTKVEERTEENIRAREEERVKRNRSKLKKSIAERHVIIPCVTELCEAGVTFRRKKEPRHMFDISFNNGVMEMPLMAIDSNKKIIFSNIVAFEQSQLYLISNTFTSYLALMDALVNTEKDVALLQQFHILDNLLQNEADAANFFNHFADFNSLDYRDHYYRDLFIKVREYSNSTWHMYRARLMRDYFNNPWSIISVVAAGVLMIFAGLQTYYTVYSSYHK